MRKIILPPELQAGVEMVVTESLAAEKALEPAPAPAVKELPEEEEEVLVSEVGEELLEAAAEADESAEEILEELAQVLEDEPADASEEPEEDMPREDAPEEASGNGEPEMMRAVGIRFRVAGRVHYYLPGDLPVKRQTPVVVESAKGLEFGVCVSDPIEVDRKKFRAQLKRIERIATKEDIERQAVNRAKEAEAKRICRERIRKHGLAMKLIDAEYTFDNSKLSFYFTADQRVDFRDLVKDLAGTLHTRIELRQIGVRDETKILGGYGICGRPLCCTTYLADFVPVSIKMAKEQNLSLNPAKISGVCGRLLCCLKNEEETYEDINRTLPRPGDEVESVTGLRGEVESVSVLRQKVRILIDSGDEKELHEFDAEDVNILRRRKRGQARPKARRDETVVIRNSSSKGARGKALGSVLDEQREEKPEKAEKPAQLTGKAPERKGPRDGKGGGPRRDGRKKDGPKDPQNQNQNQGQNQKPAAEKAAGGAPESQEKKNRGRRSGRPRSDRPQEPRKESQNQNQGAPAEAKGGENRPAENKNGKNRNRNRRRNHQGQGGGNAGASPKPDAEA